MPATLVRLTNTSRLRQTVRRHPEYRAVLAIGASWVAVVVLHIGPARLEVGSGGRAATRDLTMLADWTLMCVAMMGPVALPAVRHVATNSLRWRSQRAVAEFLAAYLAVWVVFGVFALAAVSAAERLVARDVVLVAALLLAVAWQLLPYQRRFRRACHRTVPLPPRGWRAAAGALHFGLRQGRSCVGVCWPLMLVATVVLHENVVWMVALTALVVGRRWLPRLATASTPVAVGMAVLAVTVLTLGPIRTGVAQAQPGRAHSWLCTVDP
jgi:predicted metal-binding membrane protein